jgi:hypothetical protein
MSARADIGAISNGRPYHEPSRSSAGSHLSHAPFALERFVADCLLAASSIVTSSCPMRLRPEITPFHPQLLQ